MADNNQISRQTRKNIIDWLRVEGIKWAGRLSEEDFLDRVVDLDDLPSTDSRYDSARGDLRQHRYFNDDWDNDWVFSYSPLSLLEASDELFGKFVAEMLHPVVRPDTDVSVNLAAEINDFLAEDGVELFQASKIGERPVWRVRTAAGSGIPESSFSEEANADSALERIWGANGLLRLFLSHVSEHKVEVSDLKRHLRTYGVAAFVAHEDIEPTLEWQSEIQLALASAHSLAALITPEFHESKWTDQEVGIAIGRGLFVFGVQSPTAPYGFLGKLQGLRGDLTKPALLASSIVEILLRRTETTKAMHEALVVAVETSQHFSDSNIVIARVETTDDFTRPQLARMRKAMTDNYEVANAFALGKLRAYLDQHSS